MFMSWRRERKENEDLQFSHKPGTQRLIVLLHNYRGGKNKVLGASLSDEEHSESISMTSLIHTRTVLLITSMTFYFCVIYVKNSLK